MNLYKITCFSRCGSYFGSYLQSVSVVSDSELNAISEVKNWLIKNDRKFIYPEDKWDVINLGPITNNTVVDYLEDSDY